ncbi:MAG: hypothetical protein AAB420_00100 [Patescibacteria group bacterium]
MKWHVWGIVVALVASAFGIALIIYQTSPATATVPIKILFFLSLFVGLWSAAALVVYGWRRNVERSFIWGFLAAFAAMAFILLQKLL